MSLMEIKLEKLGTIIGPKEEVDELAEEAIDAASKKKNIRLCVALFFFFFCVIG